MTPREPKIMDCGGVRAQIVGDQPVWDKGIFLQKLAYQFQRRPFVPPALDQRVEHFTLRVDGAPEVDHATFDPEIDFVQMPYVDIG